MKRKFSKFSHTSNKNFICSIMFLYFGTIAYHLSPNKHAQRNQRSIRLSLPCLKIFKSTDFRSVLRSAFWWLFVTPNSSYSTKYHRRKYYEITPGSTPTHRGRWLSAPATNSCFIPEPKTC